jgi:thioredoxin reductase
MGADNMRKVTIRIDEKIWQVIEKNAEEQSIKSTRYARSLLEKGLVIDHQIQSGSSSNKTSQQEHSLSLELLEIAVENVMLTRKLVRISVQTQEEHRAILEAAGTGAKKYREQYIANKVTV